VESPATGDAHRLAEKCRLGRFRLRPLGPFAREGADQAVEAGEKQLDPVAREKGDGKRGDGGEPDKLGWIEEQADRNARQHPQGPSQ
jgi:hypothetical protein